MIHNVKKLISTIASVALLITSVSVSDIHSQAACIDFENEKTEFIDYNSAASGTYGENNTINWLYYKGEKLTETTSKDSVLILEGEGAMNSFTMDDIFAMAENIYEQQGWYRACRSKPISELGDKGTDLYENLPEVFIGGEITTVGAYSFGMQNVKTIWMGKNVTSLKEGCFAFMEGVKEIYFYGELTEIEDMVLDDFGKITTIHIMENSSNDTLIKQINKSVTIVKDLTVDDTPLRIALKKGMIVQNRHLDGAGYTKNSWDSLMSALESGQSTLDSADKSEESVNAATEAIDAALDELIPTTALDSAIAAAEELESVKRNYTEDSWKVLAEALEVGKTALKTANTEEKINTLASDITNAIKGLVELDLDTVKSDLNDVVAETENLIETDYTEKSWTALQEALSTADSVTNSTTVAAITSATSGVREAIDSLVIEYPTDWYGLARLYYGKMTTILSGTADKEMAGAVKAEVTFNCTEDTSYNPYTTIELRYNELEKYYQKYTGTDDSYANGTKGWKETLEIPEIKEGDSYKLEGWTYCWSTAKEDVFRIVSVDFYDAKDKLLKSFEAESTEGPEGILDAAIKNAEESAAAITKDDYSEDVVAALDNAIASAKELAKEENMLPSAIKNAVAALKEASSNLATDVKTALDNSIATAEGIKNESDYTAESWKALQDAITAAKNAGEDVSVSEMAALKKAVDDAVQGLKKVTPATQAPNNTSNPSTGGSINSPAPTAPTTVTKPGKPAIKKVTAKKSKLTVKLKKKIAGATGYQIVVSNTKKFKKTNKVTVKNGKKVTISVKYKKLKIKKGKKYFVKVRAVKKANGKNVYGKYSGVKKFTAK